MADAQGPNMSREWNLEFGNRLLGIIREEREKAMANQIWYREVRELENRGAVDPAPSSEVEGTLLVGRYTVLDFASHQSSFGEDDTTIYPAFHNGARCWLRRDVWNPAYGYSASGTQEEILSFEDGVKLFLEQGVFAFPEPEPVKA